jgi:hypothetical protein
MELVHFAVVGELAVLVVPPDQRRPIHVAVPIFRAPFVGRLQVAQGIPQGILAFGDRCDRQRLGQRLPGASTVPHDPLHVGEPNPLRDRTGLGGQFSYQLGGFLIQRKVGAAGAGGDQQQVQDNYQPGQRRACQKLLHGIPPFDKRRRQLPGRTMIPAAVSTRR